MRRFRALVITILAVLSVQAWFGDTLNIFLAPANGLPAPPQSAAGFVGELQKLSPPFFLVWHTVEGIVLLALALVIALLSFLWTRSRGARIWSLVGLFSVVSAGLGGYAFVMSGFSSGPSSAQMGGSFITAYASFFMTFYYTK